MSDRPWTSKPPHHVTSQSPSQLSLVSVMWSHHSHLYRSAWRMNENILMFDAACQYCTGLGSVIMWNTEVRCQKITQLERNRSFNVSKTSITKAQYLYNTEELLVPQFNNLSHHYTKRTLLRTDAAEPITITENNVDYRIKRWKLITSTHVWSLRSR